MKLNRTTALFYSGLFWLVFSAMLVAMFGMRGAAAQHFATACAALVLVAGVTSLWRRRCPAKQ